MSSRPVVAGRACTYSAANEAATHGASTLATSREDAVRLVRGRPGCAAARQDRFSSARKSDRPSRQITGSEASAAAAQPRLKAEPMMERRAARPFNIHESARLGQRTPNGMLVRGSHAYPEGRQPPIPPWVSGMRR